jgi:hypothetical protein
LHTILPATADHLQQEISSAFTASPERFGRIVGWLEGPEAGASSPTANWRSAWRRRAAQWRLPAYYGEKDRSFRFKRTTQIG